MVPFYVPRMSCVGCVKSVTSAVKGVDAGANVNVDLANKLVAVESAADAATIAAALDAAGYPAERRGA